MKDSGQLGCPFFFKKKKEPLYPLSRIVTIITSRHEASRWERKERSGCFVERAKYHVRTHSSRKCIPCDSLCYMMRKREREKNGDELNDVQERKEKEGRVMQKEERR